MDEQEKEIVGIEKKYTSATKREETTKIL